MKTLDNTKLVVLVIGTITVLVSLFGAIKSLNLINYFFPLYVGLTLIGTTLMHKGVEEKNMQDCKVSVKTV